ncbi:hypothetical protein [Mucilaginibacter rubeus]|uniref:Uncharacterized protein n=1 Tax=Mucilaginibacter rubeus TaxID=2027860 RepID=A0A5C1HXL2_9SPHI|nr:hypothetical protein [Mucilaginibacter rubeus]QEM10637.1 hypothetical protein DEO27_011600 [Mucilaginibacter rubeus]
MNLSVTVAEKSPGIIVVAIEVIEQVITTLQLHLALEQIRLSKAAASLGLFKYDLVNNQLEWISVAAA